jgi:hypothetical protein
MTEEQIAQLRYPKHSGDIVLLAPIYYTQNRKEKALHLASKTITIRKGILGSKGPRVADSMFIIASMLRETGKDALAMKLFRGVIELTLGMLEMRRTFGEDFVDFRKYVGKEWWQGRGVWIEEDC